MRKLLYDFDILQLIDCMKENESVNVATLKCIEHMDKMVSYIIILDVLSY